MMLQGNPRAVPFLLAGGTSAILALFAWRRRDLPRAPAFITMMAGETVWASAHAVELLVDLYPIQHLCIDLRVAGAVTAVLGILAFVLQYTGWDWWLEPRRFAAVCAWPAALVLVAWTNPWHGRFWSSMAVQEIGGYRVVIRGYGPGFWAAFGYCYLVVAVSVVLLGAAVARSAGVYRAQAAVMLFGVLAPWVVR